MSKIALAFTILLAACTSHNPGQGASSLSCAFSGLDACIVYDGLTSLQKTTETQACTAQSGRVVGSCPAGAIGCCKSSVGGFGASECFYNGTASVLAQACQGVWTSGDPMGPPTDMKTSSNTDGGVIGNECTSPEVVCPKGCANLQTDVNNCGSCGYVCPATGGIATSCSAGKCGSTCNAILTCLGSATSIDEQTACIAAGSTTAMATFSTALSCVNTTCANEPTTAPDAGVVTCDDNADCVLCVQTGTSATQHSLGVCQNGSGQTIASDPLCGHCVDQIIACQNS